MSERNDMTCAELADVAAELALGVLTGRERAAALAHLDGCEECREEVLQLMATGEQLRELLPPAEPPAGFETRVLDRLGLPAPPAEPAAPSPAASRVRPPRRVRRALTVAAVALAVIGAGLGGWGIGSSSPAPATSSAAGPLTSASLLSAAHRDVGSIYLYRGTRRWLYMAVDLGSGDEMVTCQVIGADGQVSTVGSFRLSSGYGGWGSPDPADSGNLAGARLVSASGTVLASATFTRT